MNESCVAWYLAVLLCPTVSATCVRVASGFIAFCMSLKRSCDRQPVIPGSIGPEGAAAAYTMAGGAAASARTKRPPTLGASREKGSKAAAASFDSSKKAKCSGRGSGCSSPSASPVLAGANCSHEGWPVPLPPSSARSPTWGAPTSAATASERLAPSVAARMELPILSRDVLSDVFQKGEMTRRVKQKLDGRTACQGWTRAAWVREEPVHVIHVHGRYIVLMRSLGLSRRRGRIGS